MRSLQRLPFGLCRSLFLVFIATTPTTCLAQELVLAAGTVYTSPEMPPLRHATVVVKGGKIVSVSSHESSLKSRVRVIGCPSCVITAGFWNVHIHLSEQQWDDAANQTAIRLQTSLDSMLLSRGFTTVADLGSDPRNTFPLRRRIESGELKGPRIYASGIPIYPPRPGLPYYIGDVPPDVEALIPQPETAEAARRAVDRNLETGADLTKLFTGSYVRRDFIKPMPLDVARAAVATTHEHGKLVFAHTSNLEGTIIALEAGVDVLAHAPDETSGVDRTFLQRVVDHRMAMVPTLKMFATTVTSGDAYMLPILEEVRVFHDLGGQLIFGTDVGYMHDYSTSEEFRWLARADLSAADILRMLTVAPAERFGVSDHSGSIAPGKDADFTVLDADPAVDATRFAQVRCIIRAGRIIWGDCSTPRH